MLLRNIEKTEDDIAQKNILNDNFLILGKIEIEIQKIAASIPKIERASGIPNLVKGSNF